MDKPHKEEAAAIVGNLSTISRRDTPAALPHSRKTVESPGAGHGPGLLPREEECQCRGRLSFYVA